MDCDGWKQSVELLGGEWGRVQVRWSVVFRTVWRDARASLVVAVCDIDAFSCLRSGVARSERTDGRTGGFTTTARRVV